MFVNNELKDNKKLIDIFLNKVVVYKDRIDVFINAIPSLMHEEYGLNIDLSLLNSEKNKEAKDNLTSLCVNATNDNSMCINDIGRSSRTRTHDQRFWRPRLYQLSYTPIFKQCKFTLL